MLLLFITIHVAMAKQSTDDISLDLQNVNLQDALHILAKFLHQNIVISPEVSGTTSLHLQGMSKQEIFKLLLVSNGLTMQKIGSTWFVATRAQFAQRQQDELKLQNTLDETAPLETHIWQIHYAKAEDIAHLLQDNTNSLLSRRGHVRVDARTNMLCVQDTAERIASIAQVIKRLDIPVQQVLIQARLASVEYDYEKQLGINFAVISGEQGAAPASQRFSLAVARLADGSQLDVQLAALENEGHGELLSNPSLFTANQQTASIESGQEIPYQEVSLSGGTAIAFKKAVLSLKVTPQIMPGGKVLLQLQVNQDRPSNLVVQGVPAILTRQISTNVMINNGQTIVLGGIYESDQEHAEQRIPFFGKIPLVGWLFKQQNVTQNKRELLIFVTPKIIPQTVG